MMSPKPALQLLVTRKIGAFLLISFTANPLTWSYLPWIAETGIRENFEIKAGLAIVLMFGYYAYLRATLTSIGFLGAAGVFLLGVLAVSKLHRSEWIDIKNPDTVAWSFITVAAVVLGAGMGWSMIRVRMSGQVDPNV